MQPAVQSRIIPWLHKATTLFHKDVLRYVQRLPKNSVLALEITFAELQEYNKVLNNKREINTLKLSDQLAVAQIISACNKRNITVVPIESFSKGIAYEKLPRIRTSPTNPSEMEVISNASKLRANMQREDVFVQKIDALLNYTKRKKQALTVLTGYAHSGTIDEQLRSKGIVSEIVYPFSNAKILELIQRGVEEAVLARKALLEGKKYQSLLHNIESEKIARNTAARTLLREVDEAVKMDIGIHKLKSNLWARQRALHKRIERKKAKAKLKTHAF